MSKLKDTNHQIPAKLRGCIQKNSQHKGIEKTLQHKHVLTSYALLIQTGGKCSFKLNATLGTLIYIAKQARGPQSNTGIKR